MTKPIKKLLVFPSLVPIYLYRLVIKPLLPRSCKFYPTCSEYAIQCIVRFGPITGWWMGLKRVARCNPFNKRSGGYDPVPYRYKGGAKWVV